jgi:methylmalonyl-CoA mutase N-terminal domain/subunit
VAIDTLKDMELLFDGIHPANVSTSMTINSTAAVLLAMYIAVGEKQGVKSEILQGTIQNDVLKEYAARGTYIFPPLESMRIVTDIFAFCKGASPAGIRSVSAAIISRAVARLSRKLPLLWQMGLPM